MLSDWPQVLVLVLVVGFIVGLVTGVWREAMNDIRHIHNCFEVGRILLRQRNVRVKPGPDRWGNPTLYISFDAAPMFAPHTGTLRIDLASGMNPDYDDAGLATASYEDEG